MNGNHVSITGNATREPELRFTPNGSANATFGVAVNRRWQDRSTNEWREDVSFFNVVCWGELAENVANCIAKGNRIVVSGRLDQRSWEDKDGNKRSAVEIVAEDVAASLRWANVNVQKIERMRQDPVGAGVSNGNGQAPAGEEPF